jgi:hypothetical protein
VPYRPFWQAGGSQPDWNRMDALNVYRSLNDLPPLAFYVIDKEFVYSWTRLATG